MSSGNEILEYQFKVLQETLKDDFKFNIEESGVLYSEYSKQNDVSDCFELTEMFIDSFFKQKNIDFIDESSINAPKINSLFSVNTLKEKRKKESDFIIGFLSLSKRVSINNVKPSGAAMSSIVFPFKLRIDSKEVVSIHIESLPRVSSSLVFSEAPPSDSSFNDIAFISADEYAQFQSSYFIDKSNGEYQPLNVLKYLKHLINFIKNQYQKTIPEYPYKFVSIGVSAKEDLPKFNMIKSLYFLYINLIKKTPHTELPLFSKTINGNRSAGVKKETDNIHCGQMGNSFPLGESQRDAMDAFLKMEDGEHFAVNGPPGTGKTTFLQSLVATEIVDRALNDKPCLKIIGVASTNQAGKNISDSFASALPENPVGLEVRLFSGFEPLAGFQDLLGQKIGKPEDGGIPIQEFQAIITNCFSEEFKLDQLESTILSNAQKMLHKEDKSIISIGECEVAYKEGLRKLYSLLKASVNFREFIVENSEGFNQKNRDLEAGEETYKLAVLNRVKQARLMDDANKSIDRCQARISHLQRLLRKLPNKELLTEIYETFVGNRVIFQILKLFGKERFSSKVSKVIEHIDSELNDSNFLIQQKEVFQSFHFKGRSYVKTLNVIQSEVNKVKVIVSKEVNDQLNMIAKLNSHKKACLSIVEDCNSVINPHEKTRLEVKKLDEKCSTLKTSLKVILDSVFVKTPVKIQDFEFIESKGRPILEDHRSFDFAVSSLDAFNDTVLRYFMFHISLRMFELRFLKSLKESECSFPTLAEKYAVFQNIVPCFITTFNSCPNVMQEWVSGSINYFFNHMDYLVADEAGQTPFYMAAPAFAFSKRAIIIGDTKQIKPVYPFANNETDKYCAGNNESLFDSLKKKGMANHDEKTINQSLMSVSQKITTLHEKGRDDGVMLKEHRRCVNEIIKYCNSYVYQDCLTPLTGNHADVYPNSGEFAPLMCEWIDGSSISSGSRSNLQEAQAIVKWLESNKDEIIKRFSEDGERKGLSDIVGVVTPFTGQKELIVKELKKSTVLAPPDSKAMTIGTVHALQGAERELIIFSSTYGSNDNAMSFIDSEWNLLNVAISRAKATFMVFGNKALYQKSKNKNTPTGGLATILSEYDSRYL